MNWIYQGKELEEIPEGIQGFVYMITNTKNGMKYIGKKNFWLTKTRQIKGKKKKYKTESDWKEYYGSNDELKNLVAETEDKNIFHREILIMCRTKSEMSYFETKMLFDHDVLLYPSLYYNRWLSAKITSIHMSKLAKEKEAEKATMFIT